MDRPVRPSPGWPPPYEPRPPPVQDRIRHVWVLPPMGRPGAKQGLVVTWRQVQRGASPPAWQALVVVVDDRTESARLDWYYATELVPVRSTPPV